MNSTALKLWDFSDKGFGDSLLTQRPQILTMKKQFQNPYVKYLAFIEIKNFRRTNFEKNFVSNQDYLSYAIFHMPRSDISIWYFRHPLNR